MGKPRNTYSKQFREDFVRRYHESGKTMRDFVQEENVSYHSGLDWVKKCGQSGDSKRHRNGPYSPEERRQAIEAYQKNRKIFVRLGELLQELSFLGLKNIESMGLLFFEVDRYRSR